MSTTDTLLLTLPPAVRNAVNAANVKILEAYRSAKNESDAALYLLFGMNESQFDVARKLSHTDIRRFSDLGLPIWASRIEFASLGEVDSPLVELDNDRIFRTLNLSLKHVTPV
ncbi:hypothetical protein [Paraburkholderia sp. J8-2]|uniref:hypothetical protein n=1 Tax=Paraburkholderia sp. J8-2 TaxID=2805440 RepID=UPI002AB7C184|nr:hypothetical protein [Paraburkholderia sp. J8-2]